MNCVRDKLPAVKSRSPSRYKNCKRDGYSHFVLQSLGSIVVVFVVTIGASLSLRTAVPNRENFYFITFLKTVRFILPVGRPLPAESLLPGHAVDGAVEEVPVDNGVVGALKVVTLCSKEIEGSYLNNFTLSTH